MDNAIKALTAFTILAVGFGCATTEVRDEGIRTDPTHRWVTELDVSRTKYNFDNKACAEESMVDVEAVRVSDPEFTAYEHCMTARGYDLATY